MGHPETDFVSNMLRHGYSSTLIRQRGHKPAVREYSVNSALGRTVLLPVAVTFGIIITVVGFGPDAVASGGGSSFVFVAIMLVVAIAQGLIIGLIAVLATKLAYRATAGPAAASRSRMRISLAALLSSGAVAAAVLLYMSVAPQRVDHPSIAVPVIVIALVAGLSAAIAVLRRGAGDNPDTNV
ncbi:membrane protein YdbS with pleckstrin-like domain [Rhodococcus sp. OAS809]